MPPSHPAIEGDLGISAECPTAPSTTISTVAATSSAASTPASAGAHRSERTPAPLRTLGAATLTKRASSQRRPHGLRLEIRVEAVVPVLAADARRLEAAERRRRVDDAPRVYVDGARA